MNWTDLLQSIASFVPPLPHVTIEDAIDKDDPRYSEEDEAEEEVVDNSTDAHAANAAQHQPAPKMPWLKGGTYKGHQFPKQDQKKSAVPPTNGNCYVCNSTYHYAQECPLYGEWDTLTKANLVHFEVDEATRERDTRDYYSAFLVSMNTASLYSVAKPKVIGEAFTVQMQHEKKGKEKGKEPPQSRRPGETIRSTPDADRFSALGTCTFHLKANLSDEEQTQVKAHLDSGADITLISEEFFSKLKGLPAPKIGLRMKLFSLTGNAKVLGYTHFDIEVEVTNGSTVIFAVEAYLRRFGIQGQKSLSSGEILCSPKDISKNEGGQKREKGFLLTYACLHRQGLLNSWWIRLQHQSGEDSDLGPALTTWIHTDNPIVPMANLGNRPTYIRARELIGHLFDPSMELDKPKDEEELNRMITSVESIQTLIGGSLGEQELGQGSKSMPIMSEGRFEDEQE
ncbi:hypothetical protein C8J56DRAFT_883467 [Mycena floridula]|nr:hypothetical protein C8J56DRAFT_883467 [Mycena floridula]